MASRKGRRKTRSSRKGVQKARPRRKVSGTGIFGEKIFTMEEEHSLLLFTAGICFGIGLVALTVEEYSYAAASLFVLLLVLLFIDKRITENS